MRSSGLRDYLPHRLLAYQAPASSGLDRVGRWDTPAAAVRVESYAACGRFDLLVHHMLYPWDIAAGILLVREAGGAITDRDGGPVGHPQQRRVPRGA